LTRLKSHGDPALIHLQLLEGSEEETVAMTKWAPFGAFTELEQEMHTLLDHFGGRPWLEGFGWRPDTDIYREDGTLVVEVDLPGIDPAVDLKIHVLNNVLRIEGEKCDSHAVDEADRYLRERRCGSFSRSVILPDGVDAGTVTAVYENGGLTVRIPVPETSPAENDAHEIQIT
jgi:HSP20 family molecular chaperone IbpA